MDDEIFQKIGARWAEEMHQGLAALPYSELRLLLHEAQAIVLRLDPAAIRQIAEKEITQDRHVLSRMIVNSIVERLGSNASHELIELKRKLDQEALFRQMMD